jgi:hypothetical protein
MLTIAATGRNDNLDSHEVVDIVTIGESDANDIRSIIRKSVHGRKSPGWATL